MNTRLGSLIQNYPRALVIVGYRWLSLLTCGDAPLDR